MGGGGGALIREGALIGTEGTKSNHHGILPFSVGEVAVLFGGLGGRKPRYYAKPSAPESPVVHCHKKTSLQSR